MNKDISGCLKILPTDYEEFGGETRRWRDPMLDYPDCSRGCRHFVRIEGLEKSWGLCSNPKSPRKGLLTWERQAGFGCFEGE